MNKNKKTILIVDAAGRGSALAHKYSLSSNVGKIIAIPGNELMQINSKKPVKIFPDLKTTSIKEIIQICKKEKVDLVDVAQDNAVEVGLVDVLVKEGISVIGPTKLAGQIEWDKSWARDFMKRNNISIPGYKIFNSKTEAKKYVSRNPNKKIFIKASGLAEGKGAIPAQNKEEAILAINKMKNFGKSGDTFVIEDWLEGEEFSTFAISDGKNFKIIGSAQDHKRLNDGDLGPNTGGLGASTPPRVVNKVIGRQVEQIIKKTIDGLSKEGRPYKGILYLGAILVSGKVYVIEFNARWGDPEAEVLVPGIISDLFELSMAVINGNLGKYKIQLDKKSRVAVTGSLRTGFESKKREVFGIKKILSIPGVTLYGTRVTQKGNKFFVSSGRLFHVVGEGKTILEAREKAYKAISQIYIEGNSLHYRTDIGWRDLKREYDSSS